MTGGVKDVLGLEDVWRVGVPHSEKIAMLAAGAMQGTGSMRILEVVWIQRQRCVPEAWGYPMSAFLPDLGLPTTITGDEVQGGRITNRGANGWYVRSVDLWR